MGCTEVRVAFTFAILEPESRSMECREAGIHCFDGEEGCGRTQYCKESDLQKYVKDGSFTLSCIVAAAPPHSGIEESALIMLPPQELGYRLKGLLESGEGADVLFKVGQELIPAHRFLLAAQSPVFSAQFGSAWSKNNTETIIQIDKVDVRAFKLLLHYVYTDIITLSASEAAEISGMSIDTDDLEQLAIINQHLFVASHKCQFERLISYCEKGLSGCITTNTVLATLALADQHCSPTVKEACISYASRFENFRRIMFTGGYKHLKKACPALATELADRLAASLSPGERIRVAALRFIPRCFKNSSQV